MKPSFSPQGVFFGKIVILWMLFSLNACVKDDITNISDNVMVDQNFSIPMGAKDARIEKPPVTSNIPGPYGIFYYNDLPYPINEPIFTLSDTLNFNLSNNPNANQVKKISFNIFTRNTYFTRASLQIYLIDGNGKVLDSFFQPDKFPTNGSSRNSTTIVYEGARLDLLKQTKILKYNVEISSTSTSNFRISDADKFRVTIGARAELEYNIKDLN